LTGSSVTPKTMGMLAVAALATSAGGVGLANEHGHLAAHQLRRHRRHAIVSTFGQAIFDRDVASFDVASLGQTLAEYRNEPVI
jgi:hypothetical protein